MKKLLGKVIDKQDLTEEESMKVMGYITSGEASNIFIASMLTALRMKGETATEITGFIKVMREKVSRIHVKTTSPILDIVGTGGDNANTFNISSLSAIVAAGAGITVAKHGSRSVTSKCGSAEVFASLGVNLEAGPKVLEQALRDVGIAFLFAPGLHPAMKHVMPVRSELKIRTVFNILGPLANPAFADTMVVGVYSAELTRLFAEVLRNVGVKRAFVVYGNDGTDEISLTTTTRAVSLIDGELKEVIINPAEYGFSLVVASELKGGDPEQNKEIALSILSGEGGPKREIVVLNAGVAIALCLPKVDINEGIELAKESIDSGHALQKLNELIEITNG
ncbi:MAG: anthranilate phosphoribosyltransferase [Candidatus Margulisbacteria bacterium]|nr:anthranilate phosphoribosyltransferase [Candidatus Margulisiibacteriota bacterium]